MTVKEFYEWAQGIGAENATIFLSFQCHDDLDSYNGSLIEQNLDIGGENQVVIEIYL